MNFFKKNIFTVIAFLFAILFIWFILKDFNFNDLKEGLQSVNYILLFIAFIITLLSYVLRAIRWNLLFEPIGYKINYNSAFWAIALGYFFNLGIPRSGEIIRATTLYKLEEIPIEKSFATIVLERIIDLIFLFFFVFLNIIFNDKIFFHFLKMGDFNSFFSTNNYILLGILFGFLILFILFYFLKNIIIKFFIFQKILFFTRSFIVGLQSILKLKQKGLFLIYTIAIWTCYFFMTYLVVLALEETQNLPFQLSIFILVAGSFGLIFPAAGALGYPIAMSFAFAAIYISLDLPIELGKKVGSLYGIVSYFFQILTIIILGILALFYVSKNKKTKI